MSLIFCAYLTAPLFLQILWIGQLPVSTVLSRGSLICAHLQFFFCFGMSVTYLICVFLPIFHQRTHLAPKILLLRAEIRIYGCRVQRPIRTCGWCEEQSITFSIWTQAGSDRRKELQNKIGNDRLQSKTRINL